MFSFGNGSQYAPPRVHTLDGRLGFDCCIKDPMVAGCYARSHISRETYFKGGEWFTVRYIAVHRF